MRFDVLTLFPKMFEAVLGDSIIGRAREKRVIELNFIQIREFSTDKHRRVDDYPYGGGTGMLMCAQPIYDAYKSVIRNLNYKPYTVYMSPKGKVFKQGSALELSKKKHIIILCGHYEGVDQRVLDEIVDAEISIGDFVLTGGEIAAMAVIDATCRMVDGVLSAEEAYTGESHYNGLLEYPQYTRPPDFLGRMVPEVLLSGHHAKIKEWQREQTIIETLNKRPDLLEKAELTDTDRQIIKSIKNKNPLR